MRFLFKLHHERRLLRWAGWKWRPLFTCNSTGVIKLIGQCDLQGVVPVAWRWLGFSGTVGKRAGVEGASGVSSVMLESTDWQKTVIADYREGTELDSSLPVSGQLSLHFASHFPSLFSVSSIHAQKLSCPIRRRFAQVLRADDWEVLIYSFNTVLQ